MNLKTEQIAVGKLMPHPKNVRQGDVGAISMSLEMHGQYRPIVAQKSTGYILAGNHTYKAAMSLGWKEIAVTYVDVDDDQALRILLMDNRANDIATYDEHGLGEVLSLLMDTEKQLAGTGVSPEDLNELLALVTDLTPPDLLDDPDAVPDKVPAKSVTGDVWLLGPHRLVCGDSTNPLDLEKAKGKNQVKLVVTDPPYGIGFGYGEHDDSSNDANAQLVEDVFALVNEVGLVWTPGLMNLPRDIARFGKTKVAVWHKKFAGAGNGLGGASTWEPVLIINPPVKKLSNDYLVFQTDRVELLGKGLNEHHPCPKPVALYQHLIEAFTDPKDVVYEPFCGSGTTLIAAHQANRVCVAIEFDPHYVDVICARFQQLTGIKPIAEATGKEHDFLEIK